MPDYRHQLYNDRWAIELVFKGMRNGFFVEAGAANGIGGSASFVLEKDFGWSGICVEPIDQQYEYLLTRRDCIADNRCLWSESRETLSFSFLPENSGLSGLTSVNKNAQMVAAEELQEIRVDKQTVTLHDLLEEHDAPEIIHYVCLDIEGAEQPVLEAFDFAGPRRILAISIEGFKCDEIMHAAHYRRVLNPFHDKEFERYWVHPSLVASVADILVE